jgi:glycosyltransferase involved in cell wall biosynthesis
MRQIPTLISLDATPANYDTLGAHYNHKPAGRGFVDRQKFGWNKRAFGSAAALVTWSNWARNSLVDDYGVDDHSIKVLTPGAAAPYFALGERRVMSPQSLHDHQPVRLLFVGGDFRRKGGPALLESLTGSLADRVELDIVTKDAVEPRAGVRVHHGLTANSSQLLRLFADADVFVLPTHADCLGVVLMEAAAAGLPVVTTRVGGVGEAVRDGETGLLVPAGDVRRLRSVLDVLVHDARQRERMGRAGFALARRSFDAGRNNRLLLDVIAEMVETRPAAA